MTATRVLIGMWVFAILLEWSRLPFRGLLLLDLMVRGAVWLLVLVVTVALLGRRGWWAGLGGGVAALLLMAVTVNWAVVSPRWWFATHRPFYDLVKGTPVSSSGYHGTGLAWPLRPLTADGHVSALPSGNGGASIGAFFPQWLGIPDDAGGYLWSPHGSPEGADMYGMSCRDPIDLGGGWWMCGMVDR